MEEKEVATAADAVKAALAHRGKTATGIAKELGLSKSFCTRLNQGSGLSEHTIDRLKVALNVGFATDENGWYFAPLDK